MDSSLAYVLRVEATKQKNQSLMNAWMLSVIPSVKLSTSGFKTIMKKLTQKALKL